MSEPDTIPTCDVLGDLGFEPGADPMPGLFFDFGNFTLRATELVNLRFQQVVQFSGVLATPRTLAEVDFEMPTQVASRDLCAAWIAWNLDQAAKSKVFTPTRPVAWLADGRKHKHLLPWEVERARREREQEGYRARPHCTTQREWLKLALKTLAEHLANLPDSEPVDVGFDGSVLSFRLAGNLVVLAAEGTPWPCQFTLPAGKLRNLPKRLMNAGVDVSVWRSHLQIDRSRYDGIIEKR